MSNNYPEIPRPRDVFYRDEVDRCIRSIGKGVPHTLYDLVVATGLEDWQVKRGQHYFRASLEGFDEAYVTGTGFTYFWITEAAGALGYRDKGMRAMLTQSETLRCQIDGFVPAIPVRQMSAEQKAMRGVLQTAEYLTQQIEAMI